jgi:uncharacterized protein YbjT (DUF2867 family)
MKMKIMLTGATGFPGSEILRSLTKSGYEINVKAVMT